MLKLFNLAAKLLWREWRKGEWFVITFALLLAVTSITAIHFYTDRLTRAFSQQAAKFIGGDLVISSYLPISNEWKNKATSLNLRTAEVWIYPSVVSANNKFQLVNIQAVSAEYPLLSDVSISISPKTVLIEPRIQSALNIKLNDNLTIGAQNFKVTALLTSDMDTVNTGWMIAPKVILRLDDVPSTKTVLPGSRVDYRLLITGDSSHLTQFRKWVTTKLKPGQRLLDARTQQFRLQDTLLRVDNYLQLILLVCLMMSGVAISISVQQYLKRHYSHAALWRCLGAKADQIVKILLIQFAIIACVTGLIGIFLGYLMHMIFVGMFSDFLKMTLPAASFSPIMLGFAVSTILLFAFAYPVISELPKTSPLFLWRNEVKINSARGNLYLIIAILAIIFFTAIFTDFSLLTLFFLGVVTLSTGFLYAISLGLLTLLRLLLPKVNGVLRQGLSQLIHYPESTSIQFTGFTLILIFLLTLGLLRTKIINDWASSLRQNIYN